MAGTQSLTAIFYKGEYRIAHLGLWDGYPKGHGLTALEFIRDKMDYDKFTDKLMKLRELRDADIARIPGDDWEREFERQYPHLSRDGAEILSMVQDGDDGLPLKNFIDLAGDSPHWQWAYVIDFDKGTFEVYRGFNHEKLDPSERFANAKVEEGSGYRPIKFVTSWQLGTLPTNEKFLFELLEPNEDCGEKYAAHSPPTFPTCTQLRRKKSIHGRFDDTGMKMTASWIEWETSACGAPLLSEVERTTGICRSCADGWNHPDNYPIKETD